MLLLTLPMVGVAILIKWCLTRLSLADDKGISKCGLRKQLLGKYVSLCIFMVIGLFVCQIAHRIAYSNPEWKEFNRFFDNRTELYDFQYIPDYAENKDFYDSIGLSESEQKLLLNCNFELDDEISFKVSGKNLVIQYDNGDDTKSSITLKNFVSKNVTGADGGVNLYVNDTLFKDLKRDNILPEYSNFTPKKYKAHIANITCIPF